MPANPESPQSPESPESPAAREHARVAAFRELLAERGATGRVVVLPDSVHTAQLAADALGCEVGAIATRRLVAAATREGETVPLLLLTSGAHRVDTGRVATALGYAELGRAPRDFVAEHTGQVIGGVSPIGHPAQVPTYLDPALRQYDEIWAAAGHPAAVFSTTYEELQALTGATELAMS